MKLTNPGLWIALISAAAVVSTVVLESDRESPGPLTAVHSRVPSLDGGTSCADCHGGWWTSMPEACLACHEPIENQIETDSGLHGALGHERAALCALCHGEHHGAEFAIVNDQSFALAGVSSVQEFDHRMVGFAMDGRHLELECWQCHEHANASPLPEGEHRFLGLDQSCASCHEDVHEGRYGLACADCHGQRDFSRLEAVGHERVLPLTGGHAPVQCAGCHEPLSEHSLDHMGRGRTAEQRACLDCHASPHDRGFLENAAATLSVEVRASCGACHESGHTAFDDPALTITPGLHASSGFSLDAPHDRVACIGCHDPAVDGFAARFPGRQAMDCAQCHEDPHGGQFESAGCVECHESAGFDPHAFTLEKHRQTPFALTGAHVDLECEACHRVAHADAPRRFRGTPVLCDACHQDAHRSYFDLRASELGGKHGQCEHCHFTTSFSDRAADRFDHGHYTGFAVRGAHAQTECESCHPRTAEPDLAGRTFGRVDSHFGAYQGCVTCHVDPHRGAFDRPQLPRVVDGRTDCARCHDDSSFRALSGGFDHLLWTGFPLQGAHETVGCSACHVPLDQPDQYGRTWSAAPGNACADCHADTHAGQFEIAGRTDCSRCHSVGTEFADLSFNHEIQSRFRLGDAHADVACSKCHLPVQIGDVEVVRYRPLGTECVYCHGDQNDPLRRNRGRSR